MEEKERRGELTCTLQQHSALQLEMWAILARASDQSSSKSFQYCRARRGVGGEKQSSKTGLHHEKEVGKAKEVKTALATVTRLVPAQKA